MIIFIGGCTASGKTALALAIAEVYGNCEIINGDSLQLYKDLQILTARPFESDFCGVPHHLYGVLGESDIATVAWWKDQASGLIDVLTAKNKTVLVVGGTGLYFKAIIQGLSPMPVVDESIRAYVRERQQTLSHESFEIWVKEMDPLVVGRLQDKQRLARAAEVKLASGESILTFQGRAQGGLRDYRLITLLPPREGLYERINQRFLAMLEQGAIEEVKELQKKPHSPLMKALGCKEIMAYLEGALSLEKAIELAQQVSRNYAKRQTTWFRHQLPPDIVIESLDWDVEDIAKKIYNQ